MSPFPDPLTGRARSTPDRTALVEAASGATVRYDELDAAVATLAARLAGLGLEPGDHLGMLARTSVDAVALVHAAWRRGLRLVPLNVRLAEPELAPQADRADLDALACAPDAAATARAVTEGPVVSLPGGRTGALDGIAEEGGAARSSDGGEDGVTPVEGVRPLGSVDPAALEPATWRADDPALSMFTSGTTGEPKAVTLTMGNLLASATASAFRLGVLPTDRWLLCLPVYHMGGLAPVLRTTLYGTALVVQSGGGGFDARSVARTTHKHDVTGLSLVPTQLDRILDAGADAGRQSADERDRDAGDDRDERDDRTGLADSVRTVLLGGAPAPRALIECCERLGVPVHPTYGLTETASQVATATPRQAFDHPGTVGQPLLGTTVTVVDDDLEPVPAGEPGEIVVSGPTVTPGYYDDPVATERASCEHGLRTGDVGRLDDAGRLRVAGRLDDRIVTGGENVHPAEVEAVLSAHPAVDDVAVVGLDDPEWGERVAALVVPAGSEDAAGEDAAGAEPACGAEATAGLDADALHEHARERLAGFKVPKTLGTADALPRTASGTVDREAVRRALRE